MKLEPRPAMPEGAIRYISFSMSFADMPTITIPFRFASTRSRLVDCSQVPHANHSTCLCVQHWWLAVLLLLHTL